MPNGSDLPKYGESQNRQMSFRKARNSEEENEEGISRDRHEGNRRNPTQRSRRRNAIDSAPNRNVHLREGRVKVAKKNELGYVSDDPTWRYEEDGLTVTRTCGWSAPGCHPVGCGMKLYTDKEGNLVRVEGDEDHPINQGSLCIRCLTMKEYLNNKDRVKYPMKRAKADRGKDTWERISWDLSLIHI